MTTPLFTVFFFLFFFFCFCFFASYHGPFQTKKMPNLATSSQQMHIEVSALIPTRYFCCCSNPFSLVSGIYWRHQEQSWELRLPRPRPLHPPPPASIGLMTDQISIAFIQTQLLWERWLPVSSTTDTKLDRRWVNGMSGRYYEATNNDNMYNFPNEAARRSPVTSPNSRRKVKREGFHESCSSPSLARETLKRNAEEGNKREVRSTHFSGFCFKK